MSSPTPCCAAAARHVAYLDGFLASGFKALDALERLDQELGASSASLPPRSGEDGAGGGGAGLVLPGLGLEKAGRLLAACSAEPSLLSAIYWVLCAGALLGGAEGRLAVGADGPTAERVRGFISACRCATGGFAPHPAHGAQLLATLSGVQLLLLLAGDEERGLGAAAAATDGATVRFVRSLRLADGSFRGRAAASPAGAEGREGEGDCRFVYTALCTLALLGDLDERRREEQAEELAETVAWILRCQNLDGGFGCRPDGECESHSGHTFCCLAALHLAGGLGKIDRRGRARLVRWLCSRQCPGGGLNGRPGKAPDACYTWWTLASTELLLRGGGGRRGGAAGPELELHEFFDLVALRGFVARCAGSPTGGVAAHPGDDPDPFHTFFGLAGLSLLEHSAGAGPRSAAEPGPADAAEEVLPPRSQLGQISPVVALPLWCIPPGLLDGRSAA